MRSPMLTVLALVLSVPAFAQSRPIPREITQQLTADDSGGCKILPRDLKATWVDLNNDHIPELLVKIDTPCMCGASGNCSWFVFQKTEVGYVTLKHDLAGQRCYAKNSSSNGFKDLVTEHHMGATETAMTVYKWDGRAYKEAACYTKENISQTSTPIYRITPTTCTPEETAQDPPPQLTHQRPREDYQSSYQNKPSGRAITPGAFTVGAGRYVYFPIQTTESMYVSGRVTASGGSGNDIEVFILGQDEFINWQNGHSVRTWLNSGRVTVANIFTRLPPGNYYLVFSNRFSVMSPKAVTGDVFVTQ